MPLAGRLRHGLHHPSICEILKKKKKRLELQEAIGGAISMMSSFSSLFAGFFFQLILSLPCLLVQTHGVFVPNVTYVSFLASGSTSALNETMISRSAVIIDNSDDSPLIEVKLPVVFPYFGSFIDRVFVSPNGFVQTTAAAITSPYFSSPCSTVYHGAICGYLADLTTVTFSTESSISVLQDNTTTSIVFKHLKVFSFENETFPDLDFSIHMFSDGSIIIDYDSITHLNKIDDSKVDACSWLSGLVSRNDDIMVNRGKITSEQSEIQRNIWDTGGKGVYPSTREGVKSGSRFVSCPISTTWCGSPSKIDDTTEFINITTLSMACINSNEDVAIDIAIQMENSLNYDFDVDENRIANCFPLNDEYSSPFGFSCDIGSSNVTDALAVGTVYMQILWRPKDQAAMFTPIGETVAPIAIEYESSTSGSYTCSTNTDVGSCSDCDICNSFFNTDLAFCLDLICPVDTEYDSSASFNDFAEEESGFQKLYIDPSCNCSEAFVAQVDNEQECCDIADIDCKGVCEGGAEEGLTGSGHAICCLSTQPPDCEGVCGGTTKIDTCNVCGGNDTGIVCPIGVEVDTGENTMNSNHHITPTYDAVNSSFQHVSYVTVFNTFNTSIFVKFALSSEKSLDSNLGPEFDLPAEVEILGYQNYTFNISSNIAGILSGALDGWEVKTISLL